MAQAEQLIYHENRYALEVVKDFISQFDDPNIITTERLTQVLNSIDEGWKG